MAGGVVLLIKIIILFSLLNSTFCVVDHLQQEEKPASKRSSSSSSNVPALFVIGDSSVDSGTNNFLGTLARADRLPYGRDFDTHRPTGRFSNGKIPVDFLGISSCPFQDFPFFLIFSIS